MVQSPGSRGLVRSFAIPVARDSSPDLTVTNIIVLDGHAVSSKVSKALNPGVLECGDGLIEESHHGISQIQKCQHVLQGSRQPVTEKFKERMDAMAPHACRHSILGCKSTQGRTG